MKPSRDLLTRWLVVGAAIVLVLSVVVGANTSPASASLPFLSSSPDSLSASFSYGQADPNLAIRWASRSGGKSQPPVVAVKREDAPWFAFERGSPPRTEDGGRQLVQWGDGSGFFNVSIAVAVVNENILVDDAMNVFFIPDNFSDPRQEFFIGNAPEIYSVCQAPGQRCRGSIFIPPELGGVCPTLYGDEPVNFPACDARAINVTNCATSAALSQVILPIGANQVSCIRLVTSSWLQCGNVGMVKLYWIKGNTVFEPEKGGFARFGYYRPEHDPMDLLGCFVIPPFPSVSPTQSSTASNTPSQTSTSTKTGTATLSKSFSSSASTTGTASNTASITGSISYSKTGSISLSSSQTASSTPTSSGSISYSASETASISFSKTVSRSFSASASISFSPTVSASVSFSQTGTRTQTPSATETVSISLSRTETASQTQSPSNTKTGTATVSTSLSATVSISVSSTQTATKSETGTLTQTASNTRTPSQSPSNTRTISPTMSESLSATVSTSFSPTMSKTRTETGTNTITPSETASLTKSATLTRTGSGTTSISFTSTVSASFSATITATPSDTPSYSASLTGTRSSSQTPSNTKSGTASLSLSLSQTVSISLSATSSSTASFTPSNTGTASYTPSESETVTLTGTASHSKTNSKTPGNTPSRTASKTPSQSITSSETASITESASQTESATYSRTASQTSSSTKTGTSTVSISFSETSSFTATGSKTAAVTTSPTATVSASATVTRTSSPTNTASPSETATLTATSSNTITSTISPSRTAFPSGPSTPSVSPFQSETPTRTALVTPTPTSTNTTANGTLVLAFALEATPIPLTGEQKIGIVAGLLGLLFMLAICALLFWIFGMPRYRKWRKKKEKERQKELKRAAAAAALREAKSEGERLQAKMQALKAGGYGNKGVAAASTPGESLVAATPMFSLRLTTDKNKQSFPPNGLAGESGQGENSLFGHANALHLKRQQKVEAAAAAAKKKKDDSDSESSQSSKSTGESDDEEEEPVIPVGLAPVKPVPVPPPRRPGPATAKKAANLSDDPIFAAPEKPPEVDGAVDPLFALSNPLRAPVPSVSKAQSARPSSVHRNSMAIPQHVLAAEAIAAAPPVPPPLPAAAAKRISALAPSQLELEVEQAKADGAFGFTNEMLMPATAVGSAKKGQLDIMPAAGLAASDERPAEKEKRRSGRIFFQPVTPQDKKEVVAPPPKASWMGGDGMPGKRPSSGRLFGTEVNLPTSPQERPKSNRLSLIGAAFSSALSNVGSLLSGSSQPKERQLPADEPVPVKAPAPKGSAASAASSFGPSSAVAASKKKWARLPTINKPKAARDNSSDAGRKLEVGEGLIETEDVKKETVALRPVAFVKGDAGFSQRRMQRYQSMKGQQGDSLLPGAVSPDGSNGTSAAAVLADGRGIVEEPLVSTYSFTGISGRTKQKIKPDSASRRGTSLATSSRDSMAGFTPASSLPSSLPSSASLISPSAGQPSSFSSLPAVGEDDGGDEERSGSHSNRASRNLSPSSDLSAGAASSAMTGRPSLISPHASAVPSAANTPARNSVRSSVVPVAVEGGDGDGNGNSADGNAASGNRRSTGGVVAGAAGAAGALAAPGSRRSIANPFGGAGGLQAALMAQQQSRASFAAASTSLQN